jgi:hypothetical protein
MWGIFVRRPSDPKQRVNKKRSVKIVSPVSSRGEKKYMKCVSSLGLRLRQHCQIKSEFFVKNNF